MTAKKDVQIKKHLTHEEYKIFSKSLPQWLHKLSRKSLLQALNKTKQLIYKNKKAKAGSKTRPHSKTAARHSTMLSTRIKNLKIAHKKFLKTLHLLDESETISAQPKSKSQTHHAKARINLHDANDVRFHNIDQRKNYDKSIKLEREKNSAGRLMSKRIAGYLKARTRKGQIDRDRVSTSKPK